jgi:hypothetical protein
MIKFLTVHHTRFRLYFLIIFSLWILPITIHAQFQNNWQPKSTHGAESHTLQDSLRDLMDRERKYIGHERNPVVAKLNQDRARQLYYLVKDRYFIQDDSLENFVRIMAKRLAISNGLRWQTARKILVSQDPSVNAFCLAKGILVINIGLLGRISNEHQLAFAMAHEIAHDELDHIKEKILHEADIDMKRQTKEHVKKIITGKVEVEDIESFRKLAYGIGRYRRANEASADSMALIMLARAGYDVTQAISVLDVLENGLSPKYAIGADFFLPFHFEEYPFQEYWLKDRLSLYNRRYADDFMFTYDSLKTHPETVKRKDLLFSLRHGNDMPEENGFRDNAYLDAIIRTAEMQTVEASFQTRHYDLCLFHAMQMLAKYPSNGYLVGRIGKIFIDLSQHTYSNMIFQYTVEFGEELRLMNSFLYNLQEKEMLEIAFYFLSHHFNASMQAHYYLLHRVSELTGRDNVKAELEKSYREKFKANMASYKWK